VVPGLVLIPDFVSIEEEEVLMAVLVGPHAPWAPSQSTPSQHVVKRRVQHYGYVFDYETANVLRDRSLDKANCPPMPAIPDNSSGMNVEDFIARSVHERRGFEALAGVIERVRKHDFSLTANENIHERESSSLRFPNINQLTVNEYKPGSGIGSHVDTPTAFADGLISISLNSGVVMEFKRQSGTAENDGQPHRKLVYLPPRSLLLMSGPARYEWEHMIVTRSTDTHNGQVLPRGTRVSLTLRTALDDPSRGGIILPLIESCDFPPKWGTPTTTNGLATPATEREHVHAVYDAIATQWHHTRGKRGVLWPGATHFLQRLPPGSLVADIGCGDGKYFPAIWEAGSYVIGTDISEPLLRMAVSASADEQAPDSRRISAGRSHLRDRPAVAVADCMNLPLRSKSFDAAICVAVMHHLSTEARRIRCIEELERIVKIGGTINIQAWAMEQQDGSRRTFHADDVFVPFNAQPKYLDRMKRSNGELKGSEITKSVAEMYSDAYEGAEFDERKGLVVFQRYCHLYRKGEMEELASRVPGLELIESGYESGNYYMILKVIES
jgi:alkylated DNA repair protein alkB family protein 8